MRHAAPHPPARIDPALEDPGLVERLLVDNGPYWTIQRYVASQAELAAVSRKAGTQLRAATLPWFRQDWAYERPLVEGVEPLLGNPAFADAARKVFDARVVRPLIVYVNLMTPMAFAGEGHIDVPAFRGVDRTHTPVWLLHQMGRSGLFAHWQIDIATAVSWFYDGEGGAFDYWQDGPDRPPRRHAPPYTNTAIVGDNDFMFHRVTAIGGAGAAPPAPMSLDAVLRPDPSAPGSWQIAEGDREVARLPRESIRVSVSWKAEIFRDDEAARIRTGRLDDLDLERVISRFVEDLHDRGKPIPRPADPLHDPDFITALSETYPLPELVYP